MVFKMERLKERAFVLILYFLIIFILHTIDIPLYQALKITKRKETWIIDLFRV